MLRRSVSNEAECGLVVATRCPLDLYPRRVKPGRELLECAALHEILPRLLGREPAEHDLSLRTPAA